MFGSLSIYIFPYYASMCFTEWNNCIYININSLIVPRTTPCWAGGCGFLFSRCSSPWVCCLSPSKLLWDEGIPHPVLLKDSVSFDLQEGDWKMSHGSYQSCASHFPSRTDASVMEVCAGSGVSTRVLWNTAQTGLCRRVAPIRVLASL